MARCEDYPCCGHTSGDPCPQLDTKGNIVGICCECGGRLRKGFRSSICAKCQRLMARRDRDDPFDGDDGLSW